MTEKSYSSLDIKNLGLIKRIKRKTITFRSFFKSLRRKTYSRDGEDLILSKLSAGKTNGVYVDIGSWHPTICNNTYLFYKKGWSGINIDPDQKSIKLSRLIRPRDISIQYGVSNEPKTLKYYEFYDSSYNTCDDKKAADVIEQKKDELKKISSIETKRLSDILNENLKGKEIDIMDIDVEGMDLEVLMSNDWTTYRPRLILVEDKFFNSEIPSNSIVYEYLKNQGYKLEAFTGLNLIFKSN